MMPGATPILLKTKLHRPPLQTDYVARPQLLHRLQQGINRKLTLMAAPAGFGKSTLAASWLTALEARVSEHEPEAQPAALLRTCWLSLDAQDNNLARFLTYVAAAIHTAYPTACLNLTNALRSLPLPSVAYFADLLVAEVTELPGRLVFVLDDFHQLHHAEVQQVVEGLLNNAPPSLHLVILARVDPPLPLARLRVQNQINEVRAADLRFSIEEAEQFFSHTLPTALPFDLVRTLDERAEGWIAGLRLAALSLHDRPDPETLVAEFSGTQRHVMDFLLEQVLAQQPADVVEFLLCTSPLEMLCAPLCNEVLNVSGEADRIDSRSVLSYLVRSNLFLVALDSRGHWYRYHHLFREVLVYWLETQKSPEVIDRIRRKAADWFARNGHLESAVRQLLEIGATEEAGDLIEIAIPPALGRASWPDVQLLLASLPDEVIAQRPLLLMAQAWLLSVQQRMTSVPDLLTQAEDLMRQREQDHWRQSPAWLAGWVQGLWCLIHLMRWEMNAAIAAAQKALAVTPIGHVYVRGVTTVYYALALRGAGRYNEALAYCAQAVIGEQEEAQHRILAAHGMLATYHGDLHDLMAAGDQNLRAGGAWKPSKPHAWGHLFLGVAHYEQNHLEEARVHFLATYEDRYGGATVVGLDAALGMALTLSAQGDRAGALFWADKLTELANEAENVYLIAAAQWFQCRLALLAGHVPPIPSAHLWCLGKAPPFQYRWAEFPDLTYALLLLAQGKRSDLAEVEQRMRQLAEFCTRHHMYWRQMDALAVLALAQQAQGNTPAALTSLAAALSLAEEQPYVRTFVDLGPQMARLLHTLARSGVAVETIGRLLAAFPVGVRNQMAVTTAAQRDDEIIEPLSEREMEVLGLLAERLSDKEIAERLRISPLTVRRHSVNLYQKLHVNSRRQAVARAQSLGLLRLTN